MSCKLQIQTHRNYSTNLTIITNIILRFYKNLANVNAKCENKCITQQDRSIRKTTPILSTYDFLKTLISKKLLFF